MEIIGFTEHCGPAATVGGVARYLFIIDIVHTRAGVCDLLKGVNLAIEYCAPLHVP